MARAPAKKEAAKPAAEAAPPQKPPKKGLKFAMVAAVAVLALGGGGAWYFMTGTADAKVPAEKPAVFLPLETFTVNLQSGREYLQIGLTIKLKGEDVSEAVKARMPEVRSNVLLLLSNKRSQELLSVEGKQKLAAEVVAEVKKPLGQQGAGVDSVLFTSFVIQ